MPVDKPYTPRGVQQIATAQVTLNASTMTLVAAARPRRSRLVVRNLSASITIYIGTATDTASTGFPLLSAAGGGESVSLFTEAAVYAISASGTPVAAVVEEFE